MAGVGALLAQVYSLYEQATFVPYEMYDAWCAQGLPIGAVLEWLQFPADLATEYLTMLGATAEAHLHSMAHITIEEYESMIMAPSLGSVRITPVHRSKMRQALLAARCAIGVIRPSPEPETVVQQPAPGTPPAR